VIANPVLHKELLMRLRLRQVPMPAKIGIGIVVLGALALVYGIVGKMLLDTTSTDAGRAACNWCIGLQYTMVCLIAPVVAANCITQEKEQQTWEMLVFSRLTPIEIILGKLMSRLAVMFVLIGLFLPLTAFCWLHSAAADPHAAITSTMPQFVLSYVVIIVSAIFFATVGLFMSWQVHKTIFAIMLSYTFVIGFLVIGTSLMFMMFQSRFSDTNILVKFPPLWINPGYLIGYAIAPDNSSNSTLFVIYGLLCYAVGTLTLLWRMVSGFYSFNYDDEPTPSTDVPSDAVATNDEMSRAMKERQSQCQ
jgi:ABC-2 type transport system permease protein